MFSSPLPLLFLLVLVPALFYCVYLPNGMETGLLGIPSSYLIPRAAFCGTIQGICRIDDALSVLVLIVMACGWCMSLVAGPLRLAFGFASLWAHLAVSGAYLFGVYGPLRELLILCTCGAVALGLPAAYVVLRSQL